MLEDAYDAGEVGLECASHLLDRIQLGTYRQHIPFMEKGVCVFDVQTASEGAPQFFEALRTSRL